MKEVSLGHRGPRTDSSPVSLPLSSQGSLYIVHGFSTYNANHNIPTWRPSVHITRNIYSGPQPKLDSYWLMHTLFMVFVDPPYPPLLCELTVLPNQKWACELDWMKHKVLSTLLWSVILPVMGTWLRIDPSESCPDCIQLTHLQIKIQDRAIHSSGHKTVVLVQGKQLTDSGKSLKLIATKFLLLQSKNSDHDLLESSDIQRWNIFFSFYVDTEPKQPVS